MIREKRKISFVQKRITPQVIRELALIIANEAEKYKSEHGSDIFLNFSIEASDNSAFESNTIEIFKENDLINKKVIEKIVMRYNTIDNSQNIEVNFLNTTDTESKENYVIVSGNESVWVNGILAKISEIIDSCERQIPVYKFSGLIVIGTITLIIVVYFKLFYHFIKPLENSFWGLILILGVPFAVLISGFNLGEYLKNAYPVVELQTGFGYINKRKRINWILGSIILPLLMALFYDYFKTLF